MGPSQLPTAASAQMGVAEVSRARPHTLSACTLLALATVALLTALRLQPSLNQLANESLLPLARVFANSSLNDLATDGEFLPPPSLAPLIRYPRVPLQLLSTDLHISPIADLKDIVKRFFPNVTIVDESFSGSCGDMGTCAQRIHVLPRGDWRANIHATKQLKHDLFEYYRADSVTTADRLLLDTDVFHCSHPSGMCEFYMPFNRSLLVWATTRFEQGREFEPSRLQPFFKNIQAMAAQPGNFILANSVYDQQYVYYFTGVMPQYVPSFCAYPGVTHSWNGSSSTNAKSTAIIVHGFRPAAAKGKSGTNMNELVAPMAATLNSSGSPYQLFHLRHFYSGRYSYSDLAQHPVIMHLPYQVSIMSFFEHYRMSIPMLAPSPRFLTQLQMEYGLVSERTWDMVFRNAVPSGSIVAKHPSVNITFDPNDEVNRDAIEYWLKFADFYTFPHILLFDSWVEAADIVMATDFRAVSLRMQAENVRMERELVATWRNIMSQIIPASQRPSLDGLSYAQRMDAIYGAGSWGDY